tara:strand:+ start:1 stop:843 length:843 start_codon:yes stop_codon:yes gene_type:complete
MSTETTNGITVSGSATVSALTTDATSAATAVAVGGLSQISFGMDGMTVTLGDINNAGSGTGEGGDVSSFASVNAARLTTASAAAANDSAMDGISDGTGINVSTSIGAASVDLTFVSKVGSGRNSMASTAKTTGYNSGYAVNVGFDLGGAAVNVAAGGSQAQVAGVKNDSAFAVEATYPVSDTLSATIGASDGTRGGAEEDNMFVTAAYTMDADTTLSVGYAKGDNTASSVLDKATVTSVNISRSLGGGVSVFAEYAAVDNDNAAVATSATSLAVGTKVSF